MDGNLKIMYSGGKPASGMNDKAMLAAISKKRKSKCK